MKQLGHVLFMLALGPASSFGGDLPSSRACVAGAVQPQSFVVWTGTLYVDARTYHGLAFDRAGIRIYRFDPVAGTMPRTRYGIPTVRRTMVKFVDPERRIALPPSHPGVGW